MKTRLTKTSIVGLLVLLLTATIWQSCKKEENFVPQSQLEVKSYYPNSGNEGTLVTIEGQGFGTKLEDYSVSFLGAAGDVISATSDRIVVRTPDGTGSGDIQLKYGSSTISVGGFTYQDLSVQKVSPLKAPIGTNINVIGKGFASVEGPAKVTINGVEAKIVSLVDTLIVAEVPDGATSGQIEVKADGMSSQGPNFIVQAFYEILPKTGGKGTKVRLIGSGFDESSKVQFKGKVAEILEIKDEEIIVIAPIEVETGIITIQSGGIELVGSIFTVVPPPTINSVSPLSGLVGTEMTIIGTGFSPLEGETIVKINGHEVKPVSTTETTIKLIIPGETGNGVIEVIVNDQLTQGPVFKDQALGIIAVSPDNGPVGTEVTITGTGFSNNMAENNLTINGISLQIISSTETAIKTVIPSGASTGNIVIRVNGQEANSPVPFTISGVSTLAGGSTNSSLSASLSSITVTSDGTVFAADPTKNEVIKIDASGAVSVFASISSPIGITSDAQGNLFVVDQNAIVHKITSAGAVSQFANTGLWGGGTSIASDTKGNLYVTSGEYMFASWTMVTPSGQSIFMGNYYDPHYRMGIDQSGKVYTSDNYTTNGKHRIGIDGGSRLIGAASAGFADGSYTTARFAENRSMIVNSQNQLIVADYGNNALRLVDLNKQQVSTIFKADKGYQDGAVGSAKFGDLTDIALDKEGRVYVLDKVNKAIRVVSY